MTCGTCKHHVPLIADFWGKAADPATSCHCEYGPYGDRKYVGAKLLRLDQECFFTPSRYTPVAVDYGSYMNPRITISGGAIIDND